MTYSPTTVLGAIGNCAAAIAALITATAPGQYLPAVLLLGSLALAAKQLQAVYTPDKTTSSAEVTKKVEVLEGADSKAPEGTPENRTKESLQ